MVRAVLSALVDVGLDVPETMVRAVGVEPT